MPGGTALLVAISAAAVTVLVIMGNQPDPDRILVLGRAEYDRCDNEVISARYTMFSFFPKVSDF